MSQRYKILLLIPLFIIANLGLAKPAQAFDISVGTRLGYELSVINKRWSDDALYLNGDQYKVVWSRIPSGSNFTLGLFADLRLIDWFSLSPALNFSLNRQTKVNLYDDEKEMNRPMRLGTHTLDVELLAKIHVAHWYLGMGLGLNMNSAPTLTSNSARKKVSYTPENLEKRGFIGFNVVLDTGFYLPFAGKRHNIFLGWRTTLTVNSPNEFRNESFSLTTPVSTSLTAGYVYRFI
ncbi:hypothetical protein [Entomospira culicis]|uniref:Outer membrane protein beta-barrel domain-containing protein n=1 Tax=Entomospira culicis TaxID=2719989 RepID=A0A968GGM3_9SPIO|nr:hypothetical protein [Entomospira culicis]NIZ18471.1 hypothetical protein [Entomospira culicis]NIZ68687.1 hypothetical protein [Entomospira culicis]WDI37286.1 hypothetical protein PVA46_00405 [Entomospira culicis]WDI38915.1 hypothetical protein PVA47_00415 [Entomospira culicis]